MLFNRQSILAFGLTLCVSMSLRAQATDARAALLASHPGWVQIPGELIRPDCVHELPKGATVGVEGDKMTGDVTMGGRVIAHYDACPEAAVNTRGIAEQGAPEKKAPTINGWVEAIDHNVSLGSSDNLDEVAGYWFVPSNPSSNGGLVYLFNGMEPKTQNWILQPVLQYGNNGYFGGNYWVIASWLVGPNGYAFYSPAERVNPGDKIYGVTFMTSQGSGKLNWEVWAQDLTNGTYTWITAWTSGLQWTWAYAAVLESYNITSCSEFPANDYALFENTYVYHGYPYFESVPATWSTYLASVSPSCGYDPFPDGVYDYLFF
jgi:hypothetical protein